MNQNELINLNICLTDIPVDLRIKSEKNGKIYTNVTIALRREPDQHGNNISVWMSQSKEDRDQKKVYIGAGKLVVFSNQQQPRGKSKNNLDF